MTTYRERRYDLTYLSFGAGVQSTALLICSNLGLHGVPRADVAIFADTGYEPAYVYEQLRTMQAWSKIPVEAVHGSDKRRDGLDMAIPAFTINKYGEQGIARRQCTKSWKIEPIQDRARELLGFRPRQRVKKHARALVGISLDEAHRMKPSGAAWITKTYPLIDARLRRSDCLKIVEEAGLPKPERSACYFCPFHSDAEWRFLRDRYPVEWKKAIEYDEIIRDSTRAGLLSPAFLHRKLKPLAQVELDRPEKQLFGDAFGNECEGMCGV